MDKEILRLVDEEKKNIQMQNNMFARESKTSNFDKTESNLNNLVDNAFSHAIIATITDSEEVRNDLLSTAEKVIRHKTDAIGSDAEAMSKKAYFNNKKGACECFGYNEDTTEKWAVNIMNIWHNIMTIVWVFIGFFTFAPVTFLAKKIAVIFKKAWVAVLLALVIYLLVVFVPVIIALI